MKILILGAGKMGSFFTDLLSFEHEVAVLESDPKRMRFIYNALRLQKPEEVAEFKPELVINCVTLSYTIEAFKSVMPYLQPYCIISDIASVKTHLKEFYETCGFPYVSTHPMIGTTFAATMKHQDAPGTTFKRHMKIARGLLSEDDYLLTEILFNPRTPHQIARIQEELDILQEIIKNKDSERMKEYLTKIRKNIE